MFVDTEREFLPGEIASAAYDFFEDAAEAALLQFASDHELESDGTLNQTMYNALLTDVVSLWLSDETRDTQLMKGIELLNGSEDTAAVRQRSARC